MKNKDFILCLPVRPTKKCHSCYRFLVKPNPNKKIQIFSDLEKECDKYYIYVKVPKQKKKRDKK